MIPTPYIGVYRAKSCVHRHADHDVRQRFVATGACLFIYQSKNEEKYSGKHDNKKQRATVAQHARDFESLRQEIESAKW